MHCWFHQLVPPGAMRSKTYEKLIGERRKRSVGCEKSCPNLNRLNVGENHYVHRVYRCPYRPTRLSQVIAPAIVLPHMSMHQQVGSRFYVQTRLHK